MIMLSAGNHMRLRASEGGVLQASNGTCTSTNQQLKKINYNCGSFQTYWRQGGPVRAQPPAGSASTAG